MSKQDHFVKMAVKCGYASRETAKQYAKNKTDFTVNDLVEVYRINERELDAQSNMIGRDKYQDYEGAKTTKHLKQPDEFCFN